MHFINRIIDIIKSNNILFSIIDSYRVKFDYGYIHSKYEIANYIKHLKKTNRYEYDESKQDKYIIIGDKNPDSTMKIAVFGDVDEKNCRKDSVYYITRQIENNILRQIHKIYFKINKFFPLPLKSLWEKAYTTNSITIDKSYNYFFIFPAGGYYEETFSEPRLLKRLFEVDVPTFTARVLYLIDPIGKTPYIDRWFPYFDEIFSYSIYDCEKYGFTFAETPCVRLTNIERNNIYDIYFRGADNGRKQTIIDCYQYLEKNNVKCDFHVQTDDKIENNSGLEFSNNRLKYRDMISEEANANVLLEIVVPGMHAGSTLRAKEAIIYGKKLLSNNSYVIDQFGDYDEQIRFFSKIEDVDVEWIKKPLERPMIYADLYSTDAFLESVKQTIVRHTNEDDNNG